MNIEQRVQAIQDAKRMTVGEVLAYLQISAPMWSMIRARERDPTGKAGRSPSIKTLRRIEQAEVEAGINAEPKGKALSRIVLVKKPGEYVTLHQADEMRNDLRGIQSEIERIGARVAEMLKRLDQK